MISIIHYIPSISKKSGGTTTYMQLLGESLGSKLNLHIVTHKSTDDVIILNCRIHYISSSFFGKMKTEWIDLLKFINPDLVHVNCCWIPQISFLQKWAQNKGFKVVLSTHGMMAPYILKRNYWTRKLPALLLYQKTAIRKANWLHVTSENEYNDLIKLAINDKISIVPNAIDIKTLKQKTEWNQIRKILFLSRLHEQKGIDYLIDAIVKLNLNNIEVIIAGEGDEKYKEQIIKKINNFEIKDVFKFVGGVYGQEKSDLFCLADIFVLPSHVESFGIVVAEALYTGLPVITTKGTPWQQLNSENCGWWIELTVNNLAQTLEEAISLDSESLKTMGINGRQLVEKKYEISIVSNDMIKLYEQILKK